MIHDVIVIGGSYAGMAASLQLLRARRSVLIIDAGQRRNRFAHHSHGFLTQDGVDPAAIAATARRQLAAYPTLAWVEAEAIAATGRRDDFTVNTNDGQVHRGRRILLATGVRDLLPEVDGLAARWGRSVFHCPYCHGYELDQGRIGVIASGPMSVHQAELLAEWGTVTFLTNDVLTLDAAMRAALERKGITIEEAGIKAVEGNADLRLVDGRVLSFAGLFVASTVMPSSAIHAQLGCDCAEGPMGWTIAVDGAKKTTVPGVFACGDAAVMPHSLSIAVGDGAMAGLHLHRSLVWPEMGA